MSLMANPMEALVSYQQALDSGMPIDPSEMEGDYLLKSGEVAGAKRFDYVKLVDRKVQALAMFVEDEPYKGVARFSLAYAVCENHRGRGLAVEAINRGVEDFKKKFSQAAVRSFYVEALIDQNNTPSIKVAKQVLPGPGVEKPDEETGTPALLFYKRFST